MSNLFIFGLTGLPFIVAIGMGGYEIILRLIKHRKQKTRTVRIISFAILSATAFCAVALLLTPAYDVDFALDWLPGAGPMHFAIAQSGLVTALMTSVVAVLFVALSGAVTALSGCAIMIASSAANIAFVSGHFLARYAALEIAGLCVALYPLTEIHPEEGWVSRYVYLIIRLGDAGLLAAILLLQRYTGTLDIALALEKGMLLPESILTFIVAGLILAVWVKMGLWPFQNWLMVGNRLTPAGNGWVYATVMPNLGLYLLYRIQPLLTATINIQQVIGWLSIVTAFFTAVQALARAEYQQLQRFMLVSQGALAVFWASQGRLNIQSFVLYFNVLTIARFGLGLMKSRKQNLVGLSLEGLGTLGFWSLSAIRLFADIPNTFVYAVTLVIILYAIWFGFAMRAHTKQWGNVKSKRSAIQPSLAHNPHEGQTEGIRGFVEPAFILGKFINRVVEQTALENFLRVLRISVMQISQWLYKTVEQDALENTVLWIKTNIMRLSEWLYIVIEGKSLDGLLINIWKGLQALSRRLQKVHTGKLRLNLIWVILCIIIIGITLVF